MKNKEKFAKEIIQMAIDGYGFSVDKQGKPMVCDCLLCDKCLFQKYDDCVPKCERHLIKDWAESEYVEPKVFTEEEKAILRALPKVNWVARDENETVYFFAEKPVKKTYVWDTVGDSICLVNWSDAKFSAIKWEDSEPTSREEILRCLK